MVCENFQQFSVYHHAQHAQNILPTNAKKLRDEKKKNGLNYSSEYATITTFKFHYDGQ